MSEFMTVAEFFVDLGVEDHDLSAAIFEAVMAGPVSNKIKHVPIDHRATVVDYWKRLGVEGRRALRDDAYLQRKAAMLNEAALRELERRLGIEYR